jgi:hypothetical protein
MSKNSAIPISTMNFNQKTYSNSLTPPNFMTKKTRKGKTILKPRVPTKLTSNIGKSEGGFTRLATI